MEEDELLRIHSILHLIFHRNKNQHGGTKWWKWLSILKRTVWNLVVSLKPNNQGNSHSSESYKRRLSDQIIPKCYMAFSVVVADVQFSALGTVLFATLARLSKSTRIDKELKSRSRIDTWPANATSSRMGISNGNEDVGEALTRDEEAPNLLIPETQQTMTATTRKSSATKVLDTAKPKKKKKKKKKKKNAIDDLFDGLL
ncbi:hypothetical protein BDV12DRAFT_3796 [Aspergillus spectabilis]